MTLEVARVLAAYRGMLRNSVIFVAFAGEEEGLVGSEYFANHSLTTPLRPANMVVAPADIRGIAEREAEVVGCVRQARVHREVLVRRRELVATAARDIEVHECED